MLKFQAKNKGIRLESVNKLRKNKSETTAESNAKPSTADMIRSDPNRLRQVLLNLVGNALKFTQSGFVRVTVEEVLDSGAMSEEIEQKETLACVQFKVEDSGCGIKPEDLPKLFHLFGKLENKESRKVNQTGVGLGLAISQNLVRCLNQNKENEEIKVESKFGAGSKFYFNLHCMAHEENQRDINALSEGWEEMSTRLDVVGLRKCHEQTMAASIPCMKITKIGRNSKNKACLRRKNVLLVDDDQINILVLSKYFSSFVDCSYDVAFNGLEAVDLIVKKSKNNEFYDVILMDCNMPVMDGFEATRQIKSLINQHLIPKVVVIASTANVSASDRKECYECGMSDVITKPFTRKQVRSKLDEWFRAK